MPILIFKIQLYTTQKFEDENFMDNKVIASVKFIPLENCPVHSTYGATYTKESKWYGNDLTPMYSMIL